MGEVLAILVSTDPLPLDASTRYERQFAGAESNVAIGLGRLGLDPVFIGRVGADGLGRAAVRALRGEGVDITHVHADPGAPTGVLLRTTGLAGPVEVVYARAGSAGSRLAPSDVPPEAVDGASIVHLTGITPMLSDSAEQACVRLADMAFSAGVPVSVDPNIRLKLGPATEIAARMAHLLERATVVLTGLDEAALLTGRGDAPGAARAFLDRGAELVVIKDGARGVWATDGRSEWESRNRPVIPTDPVGAGDAFDAGFLSLWKPGADPGPALQRGALCGAVAVRSVGDTTGLPSLGDLRVHEAATDVLR